MGQSATFRPLKQCVSTWAGEALSTEQRIYSMHNNRRARLLCRRRPCLPFVPCREQPGQLGPAGCRNETVCNHGDYTRLAMRQNEMRRADFMGQGADNFACLLDSCRQGQPGARHAIATKSRISAVKMTMIASSSSQVLPWNSRARLHTMARARCPSNVEARTSAMLLATIYSRQYSS